MADVFGSHYVPLHTSGPLAPVGVAGRLRACLMRWETGRLFR